MNQRLMLYRKVAAARHDDEIDRVLEEAADRYGPLPDSVLNLADYGRIRVMADRLGIDTIDREGRIVVLKFRPQAKVDPVRLVALVRQRPELTLVPPAALKLNLDVADGSGLMAQRRRSRRRQAPSPQPSALARPASVQRPRRQLVGRARAKRPRSSPGSPRRRFRSAKDDPRAPGGVFERVGGLLSELLDQG